METQKLLNEFRKYKESKDFKEKYSGSIKFLLDNKDKKLRDFDNNPIWKKSNSFVSEELIKKFGSNELDLINFYVYINRDLLRIEKMNKSIKKLKESGKIEIFKDSEKLSDNKKIIELIVIDKYETKIIFGRLVKVETENGLFLIQKGKSRKGLRLDKDKRYFI
tara:strand:- start:1154 stop:1645 length:492 start_codon:yes stop_codon:yes gene_type:complete